MFSKSKSQSNIPEIKQTNQILYGIIVCIRRLMDSIEGMKLTLTHPTALISMFRVLCDSPVEEIRDISLFIISVLCLLTPKYYAIGAILTAIDTYALSKNVSRFHALLALSNESLNHDWETGVDQKHI